MSEEKYVVRKNGYIQGGYAAKSKEDALNAHAKEQGHDSFEKMTSQPNVSAQEYQVVHESDAHK